MNDSKHPIDIRVVTQFMPEHSNIDAREYAFAYTITITNRGDQAAQLVSRYWRIVDGNDAVQEVQGEGVVGEQPRLLVGESYRYTSGAVLETAVGVMEGSYEMRTDDGKTFEAPIAAFSLVHPNALH
ncbi:MAG: Co2+/Mg2+ efflux protein ApaG [Pseudomonadales bacterium]